MPARKVSTVVAPDACTRKCRTAAPAVSRCLIDAAFSVSVLEHIPDEGDSIALAN